jgi:hypothetical protein
MEVVERPDHRQNAAGSTDEWVLHNVKIASCCPYSYNNVESIPAEDREFVNSASKDSNHDTPNSWQPAYRTVSTPVKMRDLELWASGPD